MKANENIGATNVKRDKKAQQSVDAKRKHATDAVPSILNALKKFRGHKPSAG